MSNDTGDGKSPATSKASFHNARDGSELENKSPSKTQAQQDAAKRYVDAAKSDSPSKAMKMKSSESTLQFNVRSQDSLDQRPTAEKPQEKQSYTSKINGATYTGFEAIKAAKAADKAELARQTQAQQQEESKKHPAPAPKPLGGPAVSKRGAASTFDDHNKSQPLSYEEKMNRYAAGAIAEEEKRQSVNVGKSRDESKDEGIEV